MDPDSLQQQRRDDALSLLNMAIEAMNLAKELTRLTPAKPVFGSVSVLLTMIRVRFHPSSDLYIPGLHVTRTPCSTKLPTSSSG